MIHTTPVQSRIFGLALCSILLGAGCGDHQPSQLQSERKVNLDACNSNEGCYEAILGDAGTVHSLLRRFVYSPYDASPIRYEWYRGDHEWSKPAGKYLVRVTSNQEDVQFFVGKKHKATLKAAGILSHKTLLVVEGATISEGDHPQEARKIVDHPGGPLAVCVLPVNVSYEANEIFYRVKVEALSDLQ